MYKKICLNRPFEYRISLESFKCCFYLGLTYLGQLLSIPVKSNPIIKCSNLPNSRSPCNFLFNLI